jgi:diguanylate cyclase (GGDEF)-like protein
MDILLNLILGRLPDEDNLNEYWKSLAIAIIAIVGLFAFTTMAIINIVMNNSPEIIAFNIISDVLMLVCIIFVRHTGSIRVFSVVLIASIFTLSLVAYFRIPAPRFEHMAPCLLPMISIFLFGRNKGIIISASYLVTITVLEIISHQFGFATFIQYALYFIVLTIMPYLYEYSRDRTQLILEQAKEEKNMYDPQTGVYSKLYMYKIIDRLLDEKKFFYVAMVDIDNFKHINDSFGHIYGDHCIEELVNAIKYSLINGYVGRFGGDEFIIIMCEDEIHNLDHYDNFHSRISKHIKNYSFTISMGIVKCIGCDFETSDLIHYADLALYRAKDAGKNRIVRYENIAEFEDASESV